MIKIKKYIIDGARWAIHIKNMTVETKYLVFFPWELAKYNLKFLNYKDGEIVTFCDTDFFVKKVVRHDDMFIGLAILQSAWTKDELKEQIRRRAPNLDMSDEDFSRVHKSYKKELTRIENKSYYVGESPSDYMDADMRMEVEKMKAKIQIEKMWLKRWPNAGRKTREKHEKKLDDLQTRVSRLEMIYNRPDETDIWTDCKTTYEDFELYHF